RTVLAAQGPVAPTTSVAGLDRLRGDGQGVDGQGVDGPQIGTHHVDVRRRAAVPVIDVRHDLVTTWDTPGLALLRRPAADAPQPTRAARSVRTMRNPALGGATGRAAAASFEALAEQAAKDGVTLRSGATHVWELPPSTAWRLGLSGDSAVRVTELSTAGTVLSDRELVDGEQVVELRPGCGMVAVTALGRVDGVVVKDAAGRSIEGRGAVTLAGASAGGSPVLGWQVGSNVVQVGPATLLARGAVVRLSKPAGTQVRGQTASSGMLAVSRALLDQQAVGTELPPTIGTVGVLVDSPSVRSLGPDSVVVNVDGADVRGLPQQVVAGNRTLFLYDVVVPEPGKQELVRVSVGLLDDSSLAGVIGAPGTAAAWAAALAGSTLTQVVPDEHLTPDGSVQVRLDAGRDHA
ncbi:MAG: hypothetical protein HGA44_13090, partial [Cellulomonadaceae bacterium]|nr:hypothetical protein [Cellulomonadaceae bacterium]